MFLCGPEEFLEQVAQIGGHVVAFQRARRITQRRHYMQQHDFRLELAGKHRGLMDDTLRCDLKIDRKKNPTYVQHCAPPRNPCLMNGEVGSGFASSRESTSSPGHTLTYISWRR